MDSAITPRSHVLVVYFSHDGQTTKIARRIVETLRDCGLDAALADGGSPQIGREINTHQAVVIGAAVRFGHHLPEAEALVRQNAARLAARPGAFFSVSLAAAGDDRQHQEAQRLAEEFLARTGWKPRQTAIFAGALRYREYNFFLRIVMRLIAAKAGRDTDTSRDYVYTDWAAVDRFAREFAHALGLPGEVKTH